MTAALEILPCAVHQHVHAAEVLQTANVDRLSGVSRRNACRHTRNVTNEIRYARRLDLIELALAVGAEAVNRRDRCWKFSRSSRCGLLDRLAGSTATY
jgi:hypothetical protein